MLTIDHIAGHYAPVRGCPLGMPDLTPGSYLEWLLKHTLITKMESIADRPPQRFADYLITNFCTESLNKADEK